MASPVCVSPSPKSVEGGVIVGQEEEEPLVPENGEAGNGLPVPKTPRSAPDEEMSIEEDLDVRLPTPVQP